MLHTVILMNFSTNLDFNFEGCKDCQDCSQGRRNSEADSYETGLPDRGGVRQVGATRGHVGPQVNNNNNNFVYRQVLFSDRQRMI